MLATVENKVFTNETVNLDGKRFAGCEFKHCVLRYAGGECEWDDNTSFRPTCSWELIGTAARVAEVLRKGGAISLNSAKVIA
jgi:hypothetical protein